MAVTSKLGYPDVPKSITNPNVNLNDTLDKDGPMPFLTFIKIVSVSYEPDSLQSYYNHYLRSWNNQGKNKVKTDNEVITEKYREFLKEINLNYTTPEEKRFLSKIDFNDPYDLDVVMAFYGKKLRELSRFYNKQRQEVKFSVTKNKLKGSNKGIEISTRELVISYLTNYEDGRMFYDIENILPKFQVELEELYDTYPTYLNQTPDEKVYDKKDFDYGLNLFIVDDTKTISQSFSSLTTDLQQLKEIPDLLKNKRELTKKYMSNDWYFLSTGNVKSQFLTGKLFENTNTIENFINRDYPTTASTVKTENLQNKRERGFFKPNKTSIILVDGILGTYTVNLDNLSPNTIYFYPDPEKIGTNGELLTFTIDDSYLKRNFSSGKASNEPYSNQNDTKYYGYVSKIEPNTRKYLDFVFDSGFIQDYKKDIYGNSWGLFKNDHRFRKNIDNSNDDTIKIYNTITGGEFYDEIFGEGYNFNYSINTSPYRETIRSGLSTRTAHLTSNYSDLTLFFGYLSPNINFPAPTEENIALQYQIVEGAFVFDSSGLPLPQAISTDSPSFSSSFLNNPSLYYYDTLIDGGINTGTPLVRATSSLSANATQTNRTSALYVLDGGVVGDGFDVPIDFTRTDYYYDDSVLETSQYSISSFPEQIGWELNGKILIKNTKTREVLELLEIFPFLTVKFNNSVISELENNILSFEIASDTVFIETKTYLIIFKIKYENGVFVDSKEEYHLIEHFSHVANDELITNRFKVGQKVYYSTLVWASPSGTNNIVVYPTIYQYDIQTNKNNVIYSTLTQDLSFLAISSLDVLYEDLHSPVLTYSSRSDIFNLSFLMKDQNNYPRLHSLDFELNPDLTWINHNIKNFGGFSYTNTLSSLDNLNCYLSSGPVSFSGNTLII